MKDDILIGDTPKAVRRRRRLAALRPAGRLWKHSGLADIEGIVPREAFDDYLIFTIVRNPWDRMVSYYHWLRAQSFDHSAVRIAGRLEFGAFLAHPEIAASVRAAPYGSYLRDGAGEERAARFLRLEQLGADVQDLAAELGVRLALAERVNASARARDWRTYYDAEGAERVAQLCATDIERFGYRFDP